MSIVMKNKPFGEITSMSGIEVSISISKEIYENKLEQNATIDENVNKLYVGTVGDIFLIGDPELKDRVHFGIFEEIKLISDSEDESKNKAVAIAKVIGYQDSGSNSLSFRRGVGHYPRFNSKCYLLTSAEKKELFNIADGKGIIVGTVAGANDEQISIDINKFLNKHSVILGSTGSGKSCTVASILQKVLNTHLYSHIIFFDLHNEYSAAFIGVKKDKTITNYKVNKVPSKEFKLPYWFLNFEEFQSVFLGDIDYGKNSDGFRHLKDSILELKEQEYIKIEDEIGKINKININSPLKFSIDDLIDNLTMKNEATIWASDGKPAIDEETNKYIKPQGQRNVERKSTGQNDKVNKLEDCYGKCTQIIEKIRSIRNDRRFEFLFPSEFECSKTLYGYLKRLFSIKDETEKEQRQITILDLSTIPSEIVPVTIGIIARICFEYKLWDEESEKLPLYLVLEEAHNYIPKETNNITRLSKKYISRIAKEGRKYGISQLIISQRPSDLCETIISQCSNFFVLRVTNPNDQTFVKNVLPDHLGALTNMIPFFENGECLIAGECIRIPTKVLITEPDPEPNSRDILFSDRWKKELTEYKLEKSVQNWWDVLNE